MVGLVVAGHWRLRSDHSTVGIVKINGSIFFIPM
jgi:hypothetical protein